MYRSFTTTILDHYMFLSHDEMQQDDNDDVYSERGNFLLIISKRNTTAGEA